ncbi:MAG TPA: hypothetical protein VI584_01280 [Nitrospiria bacterium]|nr:hypothetical protein [Nitrospiria bacterium]
MGRFVKVNDKTSLFTVKYEKGKEHQVHVDDLPKTGEIKEGVNVTVYDAKKRTWGGLSVGEI